MSLKEKTQNAVGETIVSGTKEAIRKDIQENWKTYALYGLGVIGGIAGVKLLFNLINTPRPSRTDVHFYIHIV